MLNRKSYFEEKLSYNPFTSQIMLNMKKKKKISVKKLYLDIQPFRTEIFEMFH